MYRMFEGSNWVYTPVLTLFIGLDLALDHVHHDLVADETTGIHDLLGFFTQSSLLRDL